MKIMTFQLGGALHAVEISTVDAVARAEEVGGQVGWSGLPRLDLGALLGYRTTEAGKKGPEAVLVIRSGDRRALVAVDRTGEVLDVPPSALKVAPHPFSTRLLRGVVEHEDTLIALFDGAALVAEAGSAGVEGAT